IAGEPCEGSVRPKSASSGADCDREAVLARRARRDFRAREVEPFAHAPNYGKIRPGRTVRGEEPQDRAPRALQQHSIGSPASSSRGSKRPRGLSFREFLQAAAEARERLLDLGLREADEAAERARHLLLQRETDATARGLVDSESSRAPREAEWRRG